MSCYGFKKQCDKSEAQLLQIESGTEIESVEYLDLTEDEESWNADSNLTDGQQGEEHIEISPTPAKRKKHLYLNKSPPSCPICKNTFSRASIPRHMRNVHDINFNDWKQEQIVKFNPLAKVEECFYCSKKMLRKSMMVHVVHTHPEKYQEYRERIGCRKKYNPSTILLGKDVSCDFCQSVFHRSSLKRHLLLVHLSSEKEYEEWVAKKKAQTQVDPNILVLEARNSTEMNNPKQCPYCQKQFNCTSIKRHIASMHQEKLLEFEAKPTVRKRSIALKKIKCRFCSDLFLKEEFKSHLTSEHQLEMKVSLESVEDTVPDEPEKSKFTKKLTDSSTKAEIRAKKVKCRFCPQLLHKTNLVEHIKDEHIEFSLH